MKPRRLLCWLAVACLLFVLGLLAANVVDYVRFHRAIARAKGLTEAQWRALGDRCRVVSQTVRFEGIKAPEEFRALKPLSVILASDGAYATLYECGEVHISVDIDTSPHNQRISLWTPPVAGPPISTTLWQQDPALAKQLSPEGRLVTVWQSGMRGGREWIVLENEIRVIDRPGTSGSEDQVIASAPLDADDLASIKEVVQTMGPEVRGKDYRADDVIHGFNLQIRFSPDGERGSDDIRLSAIWSDEIGPLVDVISQRAPKDYPINFRQLLASDPRMRDGQRIVRALKEVYALEWPPPRTPWWCVWRRLIR